MLNGINFMLSSLIIELEQKLRDCSLEDKKWLLEQLHQQWLFVTLYAKST
ncbi:hypothetical protein NIES3804_18230 [Microcystis aeruginosa NIES-3804]|uniref:Uncharacterized protein n=1 Tax=Microcystis aeruginosa NIES-3804 TaxID=2517783 RepID=A0A6H9GWS5_MICAE|nr:hypothetical protein NIES3804_18230 [Microcystis aeruginosa NIES-3804]